MSPQSSTSTAETPVSPLLALLQEFQQAPQVISECMANALAMRLELQARILKLEELIAASEPAEMPALLLRQDIAEVKLCRLDDALATAQSSAVGRTVEGMQTDPFADAFDQEDHPRLAGTTSSDFPHK